MLENKGVTKEAKKWSDTANVFLGKGFKRTLLEVCFECFLLQVRQESEKVDRFGIINCHVHCQASPHIDTIEITCGRGEVVGYGAL